MEPLLRIESLTKRFGGITALSEVSFSLNARMVLGVIGPNGSGKTTLLNTISGVHSPDAGDMFLGGASIARARPHDLVASGVSRTFQNPHVFQTVTVLQNMLVPMLHRKGHGKEMRERAVQLVEFVGLSRHLETPASELSGGQQKLLEFARALMTKPRLILMDEPFAGVHLEMKQILVDRIRDTRERLGTSYVIISHEIPDLMDLSDQMLCLASGRIISSGLPREVGSDEQVIEAYLGHGGAEEAA